MRVFAIIFGIVFLVIGVAGFVPMWVEKDYLAGAFRVNFWLNIVHLASAFIAFVVAFLSEEKVRLYFQIIGIFYAAFAILGFIYNDRNIFTVFASNQPDTWLHVILAVAALILGYGGRQ